MHPKLKAYQITLVTADDVANGLVKGQTVWLHSQVQEDDSGSLFYFIDKPDADEGFALLLNQVERFPALDAEVPGTETPVIESVPETTPMELPPYTEAEPVVVAEEVMADTNPKDRVGKSKVDLSLVPAAATIHEAHAMMDGANKYGPYNWRDKRVQARVYVAAAMRHLAQWLNNEECAEDSGAHHLGHARACLGIILDAQLCGQLVDDRPIPAPVSKLLAELNQKILDRQ